MTVEAVHAAEAERRDCLVARDFEKLGELLHADLSYVHMDGRRQNLAEYLAHVGHDFLMVDIEWACVRIRMAGKTAVMDGTITNCLVPTDDRGGPVRRFSAAAILIWVHEQRWRLIAYQGTRIS